ncbi:hypothetical protein [Pannonibacter phragmitetus]|uniref:DUF2157 domain-containing protein n=1 Tax=Pannonibacter phragmitetus TaxID=121719 RepID=A0A0U3N151_9HYPH|nr:hypothetical protein [Pannonibacter phragmitetus]ALV26536.1 hypothetical protein APZ00_05130 [Pannonibacter phragmitetus]
MTNEAFTREDLQGAVRAGILSPPQLEALSTYLEGLRQPAISSVDAEELRFVRGFHDIFISIGLLTLLFGLFFFLTFSRNWGLNFSVQALAIWGLSEVFARRMRLALPSFILSILFLPATLLAVIFVAAQFAGGSSPEASQKFQTALDALPGSALVLLTVAATAIAALHYWRFRVPVGVSVICAGVICSLLATVHAIDETFVGNYLPWISLGAGLAAFTVAMRFDSRDLTRRTANSDKAFWLHFLAAPLLVHSTQLLLLSGLDSSGAGDILQAVVMLSLVLMLAFVAVLVDRRAILVSGLGYFGVAVSMLLWSAEVSNMAGTSITLLVLGSFILLLGSAWVPVRRRLVAPFTGTRLMRYVPAAQ